jgi:outer membrane autotransporter protein
MTATISAPIHVTGGLFKTDLGKLILSGTNTYTGGTTVSAGILQVSADANLGAAAGGLTLDGGTLQTTANFSSARDIQIAGSGAIQTDMATALELSGLISGSGDLTKTGDGVLRITGGGSYAGAIGVAGGTLALDGDLRHTSISVQGGASLTGSGIIGAANLRSGATIAPGPGLSSTTVNGAYSQAAGATFQAEVDPLSSASDLIRVHGPATLADGAVLNVTKTSSAPYRLGARYTVLSADGGLTGTFKVTGDSALSAFAGLAGAYDEQHAYLAVEQTRTLTAAAASPNQFAAASGVQSLDNASPLKGAIVMLPDDATARNAFDQVSGEAYASAQSAFLNDSHYLRDAVRNRVRWDVMSEVRSQPGSEDIDPVVWGHLFTSRSSYDADSNAHGLSRTLGGFIGGADFTIDPHWQVGGVFGYTHTRFNVSPLASSGSSDNVHLGTYAAGEFGPLSLQAGAAYSLHFASTDRTVSFPGFFDRVSADYRAGDAQAWTELAYAFKAGRGEIEPFANVTHVREHTDGFRETGGPAALTAKPSNTASTLVTLGLRGQADVQVGEDEVVGLRALAGWRHAFGDTVSTSVMALSGGEPFSVRGASIQRDSLTLEGGAEVKLAKWVRAGVFYAGSVGPSARDHGVHAYTSWAF